MKRTIVVLLIATVAFGQTLPQIPPGNIIVEPQIQALRTGFDTIQTYLQQAVYKAATNPQTGRTYAIVTGDFTKLVTLANGSSIAVSIAQAGSTGFADGWWTLVFNSGAGTATITPATSTIEGSATLVLTTGQAAWIYSNGTNYRAIVVGNLTGDVTSVANAATVVSVGGSTAANVHAAELLANAATNANTASAIVKRDASGNFTAGIVTGALGAATGTTEVNNGTTGKYAALKVASVDLQALASPGAPTVTPTCTGTCASTWTYTVTALAADGTTTIPGATGTTSANATTIDGTNYNTITWTAVTGAATYTVRRTVSGGTPASLGALATCTGIVGLSCVDNGLVGDASTAPALNTTGMMLTNGVTPSAAALTCVPKSMWADDGYIYRCVAAGNAIVRAAMTTWGP
jgi:hypothetical protein